MKLVLRRLPGKMDGVRERKTSVSSTGSESDVEIEYRVVRRGEELDTGVAGNPVAGLETPQEPHDSRSTEDSGELSLDTEIPADNSVFISGSSPEEVANMEADAVEEQEEIAENIVEPVENIEVASHQHVNPALEVSGTNRGETVDEVPEEDRSSETEEQGVALGLPMGALGSPSYLRDGQVVEGYRFGIGTDLSASVTRSRPLLVKFGDIGPADLDGTVERDQSISGVAGQDELEVDIGETVSLETETLDPDQQTLDLSAGSQSVTQSPPIAEDELEVLAPESRGSDQDGTGIVEEDRERLGSDRDPSELACNVEYEVEATVSIGHHEEVVGEMSETVEIPLRNPELTESEVADTAESEITGVTLGTNDAESTKEYDGEGSTAESSAVPVFEDGGVGMESQETGNSEPTTPPGNLVFSFDHYGTSPGFLDGSELLMMPHELLLREQTAGIRTTSTTEREGKQMSRRNRKNRGIINRFSPE